MTRMLSGVLCALLAVGCSKNNSNNPDSVTGGSSPIHGYHVDSLFKPTGIFISLTAAQKDGKIIIANPDGVGRINRDGSKDNSFAVGSVSGGEIHCMALQDNGQILLGGSFLTFNGLGIKYLVRLNSDGSVDNSVTGNAIYHESGTTEDIKTIAVQKDGKILIGGSFFFQIGPEVSGVIPYQVHLVRLNANGGFDPSWKPFVMNNGPYLADVKRLKVLDDGRTMVAGNVGFNDAKGRYYSGVVRLYPDESVDTSFNWTTSFGTSYSTNPPPLDYDVFAPLKDGSVLLGGQFSLLHLASGATAGCASYVKIGKDGSPDLSFNKYNFYLIGAICPFSDSTIFIGDRPGPGSLPVPTGLVALTATGDKDKFYDLKFPGAGKIYSIIKESDSTMLAAGQIETGQVQNGTPVYTGLVRVVKR